MTERDYILVTNKEAVRLALHALGMVSGEEYGVPDDELREVRRLLGLWQIRLFDLIATEPETTKPPKP